MAVQGVKGEHRPLQVQGFDQLPHHWNLALPLVLHVRHLQHLPLLVRKEAHQRDEVLVTFAVVAQGRAQGLAVNRQPRPVLQGDMLPRPLAEHRAERLEVNPLEEVAESDMDRKPLMSQTKVIHQSLPVGFAETGHLPVAATAAEGTHDSQQQHHPQRIAAAATTAEIRHLLQGLH